MCMYDLNFIQSSTVSQIILISHFWILIGEFMFHHNTSLLLSHLPIFTQMFKITQFDDNLWNLIKYFSQQHRKSYGKAKKVTFQQHSSDSDTQANNLDQAQSDEDDLGDLTFEMPSVKQKKASKKKPTKKQKMSKKEVK